jgi:hypothetical protein
VEKDFRVKLLSNDLKNGLKDNFIISYLIQWPVNVSTRLKKKVISLHNKKSVPADTDKTKTKRA